MNPAWFYTYAAAMGLVAVVSAAKDAPLACGVSLAVMGFATLIGIRNAR